MKEAVAMASARKFVTGLVIVVALTFAACTGSADETTTRDTPTAEVVPSPESTRSPDIAGPTPRPNTPTPTATLPPSAVPTASPRPTITPTPTPAPVATGPIALDISAGVSQFCAIADDGRIICWGSDRDVLPVLRDPVPDAKSISVGDRFACFLTEDGRARCWGANFNGRLGNGTTEPSEVPVDVEGLGTGVKSIAAGFHHACAVTSKGDVKCWGLNQGRYLGLGLGGEVERSTIPVDVQGLNAKARSVMIGTEHTCVVTESGGVKCWGENRNGELGDGSRTSRSNPVDVTGLSSGVQQVVSRGNGRTCALMTGGEVLCWGRGSGFPVRFDPTPTPARPSGTPIGPTPTPLPRESSIPTRMEWVSGPAKSVASSFYHSCAVLESGAVECWGDFGRLGEGPVNTVTLDNPTASVVGLGGGATKVVTSGSDSCAIVALGGVKCWGPGFGSDGVPVDIPPFAGVESDISVAQTISREIPIVGQGVTFTVHVTNVGPHGANDVTVIIAHANDKPGQRRSLEDVTVSAVEPSTANCETSTDQNQRDVTLCRLGHLPVGSTAELRFNVVPGTPGDLASSVSVTAGETDSSADDNHVSLSTEVVTDAGLFTATKVAVGTGHTCVVTASGDLKCWGFNRDGEVGDGTQIERLVSVDVNSFPGKAADVAVGLGHTCALATSGDVYCWGRNRQGQLGDGTTEPSLSPVRVTGLGDGVRAVAAAGYSTCAITGDATVKCWGSNGAGELGDGTNTNRSRPVDVKGLGSAIKAISMASRSANPDIVGHTCALSESGAVTCWGDNRGGRLGNGSDISSNVPVAVAGLSSGVVGIAAGSAHSCALTSAGIVKCWGERALGAGDSERFVPAPLPTATPGSGTIPTPTPRPTSTPQPTATPSGGGSTTTEGSLVPVDVSNLPPGAVSIAASSYSGGGDHACAVLEDGAVWCWGRGISGLVEGNDGSIAAPVQRLESGVESLSIGSRNQCAVMSSGSLKCWGFGSRIGDGTETQSILPVDVPGADLRLTVTAPAHVAEPGEQLEYALKVVNYGPATSTGFTTIYKLPEQVEFVSARSEDGSCDVAGRSVTCTFGRIDVTDDAEVTIVVSAISVGELVSSFELDPNETDRFTQTNGAVERAFVVERARRKATEVVAGHLHTCAIEVGGEVFCWGRNRDGQLGNGTQQSAGVATAVEGLDGPAVALAAGSAHTCALLEAGSVQCWGDNRTGQLGDGTNDRSSVPVTVVGIDGEVADISAWADRSCALITDGGYACWGGSQTRPPEPPTILEIPGEPIAQISQSRSYSCYVTNNGAVKCWGDNRFGQLGNGTTEQSATPVDVSGLTEDFVEVAVGADQGYACALAEAGNVRCWGYNSRGRLGDGTEESRLTPVDVIGLDEAVASISLGNGHSCAVTESGAVYCWGSQLVPTYDGLDPTVPSLVEGLESGAVAITSGLGHACALMNSGGIKCFGNTADGKLADGSSDTQHGRLRSAIGAIGFFPEEGA